MTVTLDIPDELSRDLGKKYGNLGRAALEALAAEAFADDVLTAEQVRRLLGLESRWKTRELLTRHGVWPSLTADEILQDAEVAAAASFRFTFGVPAPTSLT